MAKAFDLKILTPEGTAFSGKANSFQTVTQGGAIGVYADMIPTVALIQPCISKVEVEGKFTEYVLVGGLLNVKSEGVSVFSDYCLEKAKVNVSDLQKQIADCDDHIKSSKTESQKTLYTTKKNLYTQIIDIINGK